MKKILLASLALASSFSVLLAAPQTYLGVSGGWVDNNTDGTLGGFAQLGWHFPYDEGYRISTDVEVEVGYWDSDNTFSFDNGDSDIGVKNFPFLANMRLTIPLSDSGINLYGGGGLGLVHMQVKGDGPTGQRLDDSSTVFAYNFFAGVSTSIGEKLLLHAGYRALWQDGKSFTRDGVSASVSTTRNDIFEAGLTFSF